MSLEVRVASEDLVQLPAPERGGPSRRVGLGVVGVVIGVALWQLFVEVGQVSRVILPTPLEVVRRAGVLAGTGTFWNDVGVSVREFGFGYLIGAGAGYVAGAALGVSRRWRQLLGPVVEVFRFVIPFSWIPLTVLWFGTSSIGKEFLVAYAVFFVVAISVQEAVQGVDPELLKVGKTLGMAPNKLLFQVQLRAALPRCIAGLRVGIGAGWIAVVAAEYVGSSAGLGYLIINAQQVLSTGTILAGMGAIGLLGSVMSLGAVRLERRLVPYG